MARKQFEVVFGIAGRVASSFRSSFGTAASQVERLKNKTTELKSSLRSLEERYKNGAISVDQYRNAQARLTEQLNRVKTAQDRLAQSQRQYRELQSSLADTRSQAVDTVALATPLVLATKAAMDFEQSMLGVAKQVEGARDSSGKLTKVYYDMREEIFKMGREMGVPNAELAQLMAFSAKMGVPREELVLFTKEVAKLGEAFEMAPEEIGTSMGKLANIFKIPYKEIGKLGDVINYLDDKTLASGRGIIDVMMRAGGQAKDVHLTEKQLAALAGTFISLGKSEEVAGTAAVALMRELALAEEQPERYSKALKKLGLTTKQVTKGMAKDAQGTILDVLDRINKLSPEEKTAVTVGIFGKEYGDDIATLANGIKEYRKQLKLVNDESAKGSSDREFNARNKTSYAELQKLKNTVNEFAANVGDTVLPTLNDMFKVLSDLSKGAAEFAKEYPNVTKVLVGSAAGLLAARMGWLGVKFMIDSVRLSAVGVTKFANKLKGNSAAFNAQKAIKATKGNNPIAGVAAKAANTNTKGANAATKAANIIYLADYKKTKAGSMASEAAQVAKSSGKLAKAGQVLNKTWNFVGKAALPLSLAAEAYTVYKSKDKVKATAQAAGGLAGGWGGAKLGAALGTALAPGIGTAIGAAVFGLGGYLTGKWMAGKATDVVRNSNTAKAAAQANLNNPNINTTAISKATQAMISNINQASRNFSLLTQYSGMASGQIAGASLELSNNIKKASRNFSLLAMYTGQACGWVASLNGIQTAGQRVIAALNNLEERINSVQLPGPKSKRVSFNG